jgi:class 3 adenylate cyclase/pimeloyl-ACP methyl ester carboxylesterase
MSAEAGSRPVFTVAMPDAHADRQLLAIMFTDVVGYTAITERDEASAVRIREAHRNLVRTLVKQFDGEVVDVTGDESLSIFASALRAVDCAMALQGALRSDPDLRVRIGIHLGDVLRKDGEVIGEGVNVAARVRPLAAPGGICVSEPVYQMVRSRAHVVAKPLGSRSLKNVEQPVGVYALSTEEIVTAEAPARRRRSARRLAIAGTAALIALGVLFLNRGPILAWAALTVPRLMGGSVEQQIAFAETPDGVRIAYATAGAGPPIVFVLGWGTHLTEGMGSPLYDQAGFLSWYTRDHTVVRYDGRGFGLSDREVADLSLDARVRDLETVVNDLGLERFALYAYSAGGPTGVEYATRHPERVSHLVLAATAVQLTGDNPRRQELRSLTEFIETNWESPLARAALAEFLAPEANDVERRVLMHFLQVAADGPQLAGFMRAHGQIDRTEQARRIQVPTLVVASDADRTVPLALSRSLASLVPGARFEIVEGASHIEAAAMDPRVMRMVSSFLAEGRASGP